MGLAFRGLGSQDLGSWFGVHFQGNFPKKGFFACPKLMMGQLLRRDRKAGGAMLRGSMPGFFLGLRKSPAAAGAPVARTGYIYTLSINVLILAWA